MGGVQSPAPWLRYYSRYSSCSGNPFEAIPANLIELVLKEKIRNTFSTMFVLIMQSKQEIKLEFDFEVNLFFLTISFPLYIN